MLCAAHNVLTVSIVTLYTLNAAILSNNIPDGLVVMISACHIFQYVQTAGDRGSIPRRGVQRHIFCVFVFIATTYFLSITVPY